MGQRRLARVRKRREEAEEEEVPGDEEEKSGGIAVGYINPNTDMAATEEEATEGLAAAFAMEVEGDMGSEGED